MAIKIAGVDVINDDRELVLAKLTDINETINDTAVDVFVYDTSKDSDGGAWRHRTQHTSWYAEASSASRDEDTRSTRAEFPAVAVIVAESDKVTIYDGDDPILPMWMVFEAGSYYFIGPSNRTKTSVEMVNGILCVGTKNNSAWMSYISFIDDTARQYSSIASEKRSYLNPILNRNDSANSGAVQNNVSEYTIVNDNVNDVAMTVLPDAPTDPATGLPVPTIAVATDGGTSVIRDDGTVYDLIGVGHSSVDIGTDGVTYTTRITPATNVIYGWELPTADTSTQDYYYAPNQVPPIGAAVSGGFADNITRTGRAGETTFSYGYKTHLGNVSEDRATVSNGMFNQITSSYNTGWMPGDIKLAALADTTAETLSGSELLSAFSDASWTTTDSDWQYDSTNDEWDFAASAGVVSALTHTVSTTEGAVYVATATVSNVANVVTNELFLRMEGTADGVVELSKDDGSGAVISQPSGGDGTYTATFTAGASNPYFQIRSSGLVDGDETATLVSASVRLADPDRSVNDNGLGVYGSITKAPVATGADVVAYSGFSSSNYLEQPYNDDLDFGTGDFCVMGWVNLSGTTNCGIAARGVAASTSGMVALSTANSNNTIRFDIGASNLVSSSTIPAGTWAFVVAKRESGVAYLFVNGAQVGSGVNTQTATNTSATLKVGQLTFASSPLVGSLALLRISATAPTADQIRKIYEDEKFLFQEDAKATLTGTSDAVTALAHDPDTDLLHVGTSGGRSVFQGLRRVEEHTGTNSQSLAAISAVDGLVVEGK
jgi:hypothetical protein